MFAGKRGVLPLPAVYTAFHSGGKAMRDHPIFINELDAAKLRGLLATFATAQRDHDHLEELAFELERASVVEAAELPRDVVMMHARVRVADLVTGERQELVLVFPGQADVAAQRVSVLAPIGTALLGYREGDEVEWGTPGGLRRLRIERVVQPSVQPEVAREALSFALS
jgi:regulator of nucleoside diphosphate kinase